MKKAKNEKMNKIENIFFIAKAPTIFAISFVLLFLFSVVFSMPFSYALSSEDYLRTDKEVYLSGEIVTIFIGEQSGTYIEIETPTAKYSSFGDAGSSQKFLPSEDGNYKIILLDSENILATKSFRVVSAENMIDVVNNNLLIINQSENNENNSLDIIINNISALMTEVNALNNFINNTTSRKSGDLLISTDKKVYAKNEMVNIVLLTNKEIAQIKITSESAEYSLLTDYANTSKEILNKKLNFIPDKEGVYVISLMLSDENVYYDIYFYVQGEDIFNDTQNISANMFNYLYKMYDDINGVQESQDNISAKNAQIIMNISGNKIIKKEKINVVNSKGEKNKINISFYKAQNLTKQQSAERNGYNSNFKNDVVVSEENLLQFEKYDVELILENSSIKKLNLKDLVYMDGSNVGIENIPKEKYKTEESPERKVIDSYAINLENVSFSEAIATLTAKGDELWKCAEWNFNEQVCVGSWVKVQDLIPGKDYNILLYKGDPGYVEILVSKAVHFDVNGIFVSDVFDEVKTLDNIWSEPIYAGEFLRISFEKNLTSKNDITIYAKSNESAILEVYEKESDIKIADFGLISEYKKYQILLTNLTESQDTFDLRVLGGIIEFDYITDPLSTYNSTLGAPACYDSISPCIADSSLLQCAGAQTSPGPEPNYPNTIDTCTDASTIGTCHSDESVENITITDLNNSMFIQGDTINVNATFYCYGTTDRIAIYYTNSTSTIDWQNKLVGTTRCTGVGYISYDTTFATDNVSGMHAVRAVMLYNVDITSACSTDSYRDQDDLAFQVLSLDADMLPAVSLSYPNDNYFNNTNKFVNLTFNATVSDDKQIVNCSLWTDYSGSWTLNQTQTVTGTSNVTEFNLINLNNKIFVWNIQCYDNSSQSSWGVNRTVILKLGAAPSSYLETFSVLQSADVDVIALDNDTVVLAWVDAATGYNLSFQVMNTNGEIITSKTLVDATGGSTSRVSLAPINTTAFVLGIFDQPQNNVDFFVFDRDGNPIVGRTNAAATVGANTDVKICELRDRIPVAYSRTSNGDAELRIYSNEGSLITGTTQIDNAMAPELPGQDIVSCAAINSTAFVYHWFDDGSNDATFVVRSNTGTSIVAATDYDTDVGETAQVAAASLGNNRFVSAYYDSTDDDITINIRQLSGTTANVVLAATDIDTNAGTNSRLDVAAIQMQNTPNFAVVWLDTSDTTIKAAVYNQSGAEVTAPFTVTTTPNIAYPMVKVASYESVVQTGLCNGTFVVAYTNATEGSLLKKYWYNGSAWDGVCPDYVPPVVVLNQPANDSNITIKSVSFNFTGTDDVSTVLKNCSLWTNFTGSWQINKTIYDVISGLKTNITIAGLNDGLYIWNVQCYDDSSNGAFAPANYTLRINNNAPWIRNQAINATMINQSVNIKFNVTITDLFGINSSKVTLRYPNMTEVDYNLNNSGNEHYYIFNDTVQLGTYVITLIWAKDNLGQENQNTTPNLQFNVTASPPTAFNIIAPANNTESQQLIPTFSWQQTTEENFANYTILVTKDSTFSTIDFTYATYQITNTTFTSTYALDSNTDYYWKVLANDIFGNQRNSTQEFRYITDTIGPTINLNTPVNDSFWTTSSVLFNYTPTDTNSLQSCTLYGNFTGAFARNQTNTTIIKDDYNYFNLILGEGTYLWNVFCNDTALNGKYASENKTFILDLSGPSINLTSPANNAIENNTNNVVFKVNAYDKYANLSSCDLIINDTIERTKTAIEHGIENNVEFNFTHFLLNGNYDWRVNCTDTNGFSTLSEIRNISVEVIDNNPPLVSLNYPGINEYVSQNDITFNYTPEDATGITNCSLYIDGIYNQTNISNVINFDYNYFTVPNLIEGSHTWRVICFDNSTGINQGLSNIRTFYVDTVNPEVELHHPLNNEYVTNSLVQFNYTPEDTNLASCSLYGNFSGIFEQDQINTSSLNNQENTFTKTLEDGVYLWNVECFDLSGRSSFADSNYSVKVDTAAPVYSDEVATPDISSPYNAAQIYYFNITWADNFNISYVIIEEDFSGIIHNTTLNASNGVGLYSFVTGNLSAGAYNYKWYAEDEAGNKNETDSYIYEVVKADSSVDLSLNSEQNNITVDETTPVNIDASLSVPAAGYIELYLNNVMINSGQSPLFNSTVLSEPGVYNVTAVYPSTQNYSSSYDTHYIFVNDTTPPFIQLISPSNNGFVGSGSATLQYSVLDKSSISECRLYINNILNQTNASTERDITQFFMISLETGDYNWSVTCIDNNSNFNSTETRNFSVVNINTVKTFVNTSKQQYEKGEIGLIQTNTEDIYENALVTNVTTDIIKGITSLPWWNESWKYRKQIIINNTVSRDRIETTELNITGLDNNISSCNELRIVKNSTINGMNVHELLPAEIISGQNTSCLVRFNLELNANSVNQGNLFVYYGNPSASSQGATVTRTGTSVQRGIVAGTTATLTATINSVSIDKTFVLHTQASTSSAPTQAMYTSDMSVGTEITFTKYGSGTIGNISWQAIESSDIKVQRNTVAFAAATSEVNVSINSVNLSNSFILVNGRVSSTTTSTNNRGHFNARFLNSTTIQLERRTTGTAASAGWQVVEWNNSNVQAGNSSFTGYGINVTVNAVNTSRAILFFGSAVSGGTGVGSTLIVGNISGSSTISFERTYNVGTVNITWFLVELPEEFSVQANSISMSSDQNIGLTEVDYNKAFHAQSWSSTGTTSTTYSNTYILANLTNKTNILLNKQTTTTTHIVRAYTANTYTGVKGFGETQQLIQRNTSQTDLLGYFGVNLNTSNLSYSNYTAISVATKEGFINETDYKIFEVIPDKTSPNVTLSSPEDLIERGVGFLNFSYIPYDINLENCSLYVKTNETFNILSVNDAPLNNDTNYFNNIYIDLGLQEWNVGCRDEEGNLGFAPQNRTLNITGPDLLLTSNDLYFGEEQRVEGTNITIFLNITNNGLTAVNNSFIVQFFKGDPDSGGTQIGYNITVINLSIGERITVNTTAYVLFPGRNVIYARVDFDNDVNETIESNNEANNNVSVSLYQYYYGNISGKIITAGADGFAFIDFKNVTPEDGVIFFADEDSEFSFTDLKALTRNTNNQLVGDDFSNLDAAMNTTDFEDSIKSVWGGGTDSPLQTRTFNVSTQSVGDVPVINSTNTSDFVTGILWDTNDDKGNLQYDATDKEDVVFVSNINSEKQGLYGLYDSEIKIPASLRNYRVGSDKIFMYVEIK